MGKTAGAVFAFKIILSVVVVVVSCESQAPKCSQDGQNGEICANNNDFVEEYPISLELSVCPFSTWFPPVKKAFERAGYLRVNGTGCTNGVEQQNQKIHISWCSLSMTKRENLQRGEIGGGKRRRGNFVHGEAANRLSQLSFSEEARGRYRFKSEDVELEEAYLPNVCGSQIAGFIPHLWEKVNKKDGFSLVLESFWGESNLGTLHPRTFLLPQEANRWEDAVKSTPSAAWILKPVKGGHSSGIELLPPHSLNIPEWMVRPSMPYVAQQYIANPVLIDQRKFSLRTYLFMNDPREPFPNVFLHSHGIAKFTAEPFESDLDSFQRRGVHVVDPYAKIVDKNNSSSQKPPRYEWEQLWPKMADAGWDVEQAKDAVATSLGKAISAVFDFAKTAVDQLFPRPMRAFVILGCDVDLVDNGKERGVDAIVLECNVNADLGAAGEWEDKKKQELILDTLEMLHALPEQVHKDKKPNGYRPLPLFWSNGERRDQ